MRSAAPPRGGAAVLAAALVAGGCGGDPAAEIERRRAGYEASLAGFIVRDEPAAARPTIVLDVELRGASDPPLAGLTLDVSMAGADGGEKAHRRAWIDARGVGPGGMQTTVTLAGLDYAPGDGFWVEVRSPVPAAERGEYREFGELGGGDG